MLAPEDNEEYQRYYLAAMTKDNIPIYGDDMEYLLKPWRQRVPDGAPKRLLDACLKDQLTKEESPTQLAFGSFENLIYSGNKEIWNDLVEMLGRPLKVLSQRIDALKMPSGKTPKMVFFYVPDVDCQHCSKFETFWSEVCEKYGLTYLNLTKPYQDLKFCYFPTEEACCHFHYSAYGNKLIAAILKHELIHRKWIPFEEK